MAPKSCWETPATRGVLVATWSAAVVMRGEGACAQATEPSSEGKINRKKRAASRFIEKYSPFPRRREWAQVENVARREGPAILVGRTGVYEEKEQEES